jgi:hypothetical protein
VSLAEQVRAQEMELTELRRLYLMQGVELELAKQEVRQYRARAVALARATRRQRHFKNALRLTTIVLPVRAE